MRIFYSFLIIVINVCLSSLGIAAEQAQTQRIPQFSNEKTTVWETIIYPHAQGLKMHRHDYDRVVVALEGGTLKVTSDKQQVHYLKLETGKAYYLPKDETGTLHSDENVGQKPIKVMVIQLNN